MIITPMIAGVSSPGDVISSHVLMNWAAYLFLVLVKFSPVNVFKVCLTELSIGPTQHPGGDFA